MSPKADDRSRFGLQSPEEQTGKPKKKIEGSSKWAFEKMTHDHEAEHEEKLSGKPTPTA